MSQIREELSARAQIDTKGDAFSVKMNMSAMSNDGNLERLGTGTMLMKRILIMLAWVALVPGSGAAQAADEFLDPEVAFKLFVRPLDAQNLEIRFDIAPGYYLYGDKFKVEANPSSTALGALQVPKGKIKFDETFQKDVETFRGSVVMMQPLTQATTTSFKLLVVNQGCADQGLCYPPMQRALRIDPVPGGLMKVALLTEAQAAGWTPSPGGSEESKPANPANAAPTTSPSGDFASALQSKNIGWVIGVFALAGLLLSFTPCVLPMVPILSSIIVGQSSASAPPRGRGFRLALAYALGMALVYTAFGMAAGLAGEGLAAALQNPWVLGAFGLLLVGLSLSMFGLYELQLPASVQSRMAQWSGRVKGGQYAGVFVMGGLSAVIVGPCVAAPLAGALVYISQTRDVILGGVALFAMAVGMSVPLLLVGASAGSVLPRAGAWMERVKHAFGFMLLGVALWLVLPVIPAWTAMLGVAGLLMACAVYLGAFERLELAVTPRRAMTKSAGIFLALVAALQLVGAASGGRDVLQPIAHLASGGGGQSVLSRRGELQFEPVANLASLDAALQKSNKLVMLDLYADWCVSCKEMEALTFSDESVRQRLKAMTLMRVDVTANSSDDKALMRRYGLFGPPALLFFQPGGEEVGSARVIGYQDARTFLDHLSRLEGQSGVKLSQR